MDCDKEASQTRNILGDDYHDVVLIRKGNDLNIFIFDRCNDAKLFVV